MPIEVFEEILIHRGINRMSVMNSYPRNVIKNIRYHFYLTVKDEKMTVFNVGKGTGRQVLYTNVPEAIWRMK